MCIYPCKHLFLLKRLDYIVYSTCLKSLYLVLYAIKNRDKQHRDIPGVFVFFEPFAHLETVYIGKTHIKEHQVRLTGPDGLKGEFSVHG